MRQSVASIAIIRRQRGRETLWLAQWNARWQGYHFVGGHKEDDESFRQCVIREVGEELEIAAGTDFLVGEHPLAHLDYTAWSAGAGQETHYVLELFEVQLVGEAVRLQIESDSRNRWLTENEIRAGLCSDGEPVSKTMGLVLGKARLASSRLCRADRGAVPVMIGLEENSKDFRSGRQGMPDELRHMTVAVAVIYDKKHGFLLWNNQRWGGYAFPMRHLEPGDQPPLAALQALADQDFPLSLPNATARALECTGAFGYSEGVRVDTYYDYHVIEIDPGQPLDPATLNPEVRFFTYQQLQAATIVTWSTRVIATLLVETQEVVIAAIWRRTAAGLEFLLVHKPGHGYFFPSIRRKTHGPLEGMADQSIRFDTAYDGEVRAEYGGDDVDVHDSARFCAGQRRYRFYVCVLNFPGVDLNEPGNAVEKSLHEFEDAKTAHGETFGSRGYWAWFTITEMRHSSETSPQVASVLPAATADVEAWERRAKRS